MPLPDNTIERVYPSVYFVDDAVQTEVIQIGSNVRKYVLGAGLMHCKAQVAPQ
jgi:hypothetical protein